MRPLPASRAKLKATDLARCPNAPQLSLLVPAEFAHPMCPPAPPRRPASHSPLSWSVTCAPLTVHAHAENYLFQPANFTRGLVDIAS